jgi:hypothetical protein
MRVGNLPTQVTSDILPAKGTSEMSDLTKEIARATVIPYPKLAS